MPQTTHSWGTGGHTLGASRPTAPSTRAVGAGGASVPVPRSRTGQTPNRRDPSPVIIEDNSDDDYYDDGMDEDDVIEIDSD